jgi:RHS repeat-associated protein
VTDRVYHLLSLYFVAFVLSITAPYDARGNSASESRPAAQSVNLGYDGHGRLTSYGRSGEVSLTHAYNGLDERTSTTTTISGNADTRNYLYAPDGRVIGEYGSSAADVRAEFIWMNPEAANDNGAPFGGDDGLDGYMPLAVAVPAITPGVSDLLWVHANHMGVPAVFTNASGAAIAMPTTYSAPGFPGQSRTLADLYYNKYRDYDPTTGRYIQADPIGLAGGTNPYSYAMNSPLRYRDPTGEIVPLLVAGFLMGAGGDLAIQSGINLWNGRDALDCIDWTQVGVSGALGIFSGGVGGTGIRTAAGLSSRFSNVSRRIRNAEGLVGSGKDLHHWLLPRRWETAFGGRAARIVNGRWNLNPIAKQLHWQVHRKSSNWAKRVFTGSPNWAKWAAGGAGVSVVGGVLGDWVDEY